MPQENKYACAVCEAASLLWGIFNIGGSVWLVVEHQWSIWTVLLGIILTCLWGCTHACLGKTVQQVFKENR